MVLFFFYQRKDCFHSQIYMSPRQTYPKKDAHRLSINQLFQQSEDISLNDQVDHNQLDKKTNYFATGILETPLILTLPKIFKIENPSKLSLGIHMKGVPAQQFPPSLQLEQLAALQFNIVYSFECLRICQQLTLMLVFHPLKCKLCKLLITCAALNHSPQKTSRKKVLFSQQPS